MAHRPHLDLEVRPDLENDKVFEWVVFERDLEGSRLKPDYSASRERFATGGAAQLEGDAELLRLRAGGSPA